jgi:hypothetical protein
LAQAVGIYVSKRAQTRKNQQGDPASSPEVDGRDQLDDEVPGLCANDPVHAALRVSEK